LRELVIDGTRIADDTDAYVIAEIGHNHQGNLDLCKRMFQAAKDVGCNAVKLQKRDNKTLYSPEFYNSPYNSENAFGATYGEHREALEFDQDQYIELKQVADDLGITFFATAFDGVSADFIVRVGLPAIKIASGDLTNLDLLNHVSQYDLPVIISTGGGSLKEVSKAYGLCHPGAIMQCTSGYPASYKELNLSVIETFHYAFPKSVIGFSDHSNGISMAPIAYALGARIFEKHFTLDRTMKGTDQAMSLEPSGMRKMVRDLKRARLALGDGIKRRYQSEAIPLAKQWKNANGQIDGKVPEAGVARA
jgi:sialic acid synthase